MFYIFPSEVTVMNTDSIGCGDAAASFKVTVASALPAGWAFAAQQEDAFNGDCVDSNFCSKAGWQSYGGGIRLYSSTVPSMVF